LVKEQEYGNQFLRFDLSGLPGSEGSDPGVAVAYRVTRKAYRAVEAKQSKTGAGRDPDLAKFLRPNRLVPLGGEIAQEARRVTKDARDPLDKSRRLYDHIVYTLTYDKSGDGWGRGDAVYACSARKGNCTDFHSLFIAEARSLGIPARFVMGIPLSEDKREGKVPGYHCWAEFYTDDYGWVPVDASEANKYPGKKELFFGGLDANRVSFSIGRDIRIPQASSEPLNYMIYPYVEVDGKKYDKVDTEFNFTEVTEL
jgi:transglutaminase-like putative cysteine protease